MRRWPVTTKPSACRRVTRRPGATGGNALRELAQLEAAPASYDEATRLQPDLTKTHSNRGNLRKDLLQLDAARASYDTALGLPSATHSNRDLTRWNKSLLLVSGEFEEGWAEYEARRTQAEFRKIQRQFRQPLWHGKEPLQGQTILLTREQGLGDVIQFCRHARVLQERGARVLLETPQPLLRLLQGVPGIAQLIGPGERFPAFDLHCPLLGVPFAVGSRWPDISSPGRYLRSDSGKVVQWAVRLGPRRQPRVGLVWSGSTVHKGDIPQGRYPSKRGALCPAGRAAALHGVHQPAKGNPPQ